MILENSDRPWVLLARTRVRVFAFPLSRVVETMRPLPTEPLSGMPPFVCGLAVIRGAPVPVLDLSLLLTGTKAEAIARFVTVQSGARRVALAVEHVIGVHRLDASALAALPPLLRDAQPDIVTAIGALDGELLTAFESGRILSDEIWQALDARGAAP
jgi:purine-binding chemotaxis protein CheW